MSFRLLMISTMYEGYLKSFYKSHANVALLDYNDHYKILKDQSTEFCAAYARAFSRLGCQAEFICANDKILQDKWAKENSFSEGDLLLKQTVRFQPEILWIDNLSLVDPAWIGEVRKRAQSIKIILGYHCSPFGPGIIENMKALDFAFTCIPGFRDELGNMGIKTFMFYHAFDDTLASMNIERQERTESIVFSGSLITGEGFHNERIRFIKKILDEKIDISLYVNLERRKRIIAKNGIYILRSLLSGAGMDNVIKKFAFFQHGRNKPEKYSYRLLHLRKDPVYGTGMYDLFRKSKIVLNMHVGVAGEYSGNMRMFEATGTGSCLLTDNKKNIRDLFEPGSEVITYDNQDDCVEKARWLLQNENIRKEVAAAGQARTLSCHTVSKRCEQMSAVLHDEIQRR